MAKPLELEIVLKVTHMAGPELSVLESAVNSLEPSLAALKTHELAFAQQEAAEMARAFEHEQRKAAEALVYWNEINPAFVSSLDAQMSQVELLTLGFGEFQQVWDDTFNKITFDGEVTAEEFQYLTDRQKELGFAMESTRFAAGQLSEVNLLEWAEGVGISSELAAAYIALISGAGDDLQFVLAGIANGESPGLIAAQLDEMNAVGGPPLSALADTAGMLESHLNNIPSNVNANVNVSFNVKSNVPFGLLGDLGINHIGGLQELASGGPLADLALVGEEGPELIIDGIVIPAQETRKLMALGLLPRRRFALGGSLAGGAMLPAPPDPPDSDPLSLDQRAHSLSAEPAQTSAHLEAQAEADLALAIESATSSSAAALLPDTTAASQAAAALAPSTFESANQQLSRQLGREIQVSNERLMARIDRLILETRRMKIYFRDAVRQVSV